MARSGFPSMTALLGLLAVAGYQNRDKISEMINNRGGAGGMGGAGRMGGGSGMGSSGGGLGGMLGGQGGGLGGLLAGLGGGGLGGLLGGGLNEFDGRMRQNGRGQAMDSWVGTGSNHELEPHDLEAALGPDVLEDLQETTGLSRQELLQRLSRELPDAVDRYTPEGRIPDRNSFS